MRYRSRRYRIGRTTRYTTRRPAKPRFAMVGYVKDTETKYNDRALKGNHTVMEYIRDIDPSNTGPPPGLLGSNTSWSPILMGSTTPPSGSVHQWTAMGNLLTGLAGGTGVSERVGNKIRVKWMKIRLTFNAAAVEGVFGDTKNDNNGESVLNAVNDASNAWQSYLRTTFRMCVVMDTQVNSPDDFIAWNDVMSTFDDGDNAGMGGPHGEPKISSMGRFRILSDRTYELDSTDPQKTTTVMLRNIGDVRYASSGRGARVNKGIWVIYSALTNGSNAFVGNMIPSVHIHPPILSRRLAYTDA